MKIKLKIVLHSEHVININFSVLLYSSIAIFLLYLIYYFVYFYLFHLLFKFILLQNSIKFQLYFTQFEIQNTTFRITYYIINEKQ